MNRIYGYAIALACVGFSMSFVIFGSSKTNGLKVGERITNTELIPSNKQLMLVSFWAAYDAESRDKNQRLSEALKKLEQSNGKKTDELQAVSISMDEYESIFEEIAKKDSLYFTEVKREEKGFDSQTAKELKLNKQFGNFLISADGKLVAKNIEPEELEEKLNQLIF